MENVVDSRTTLARNRDILHKSTFNYVTVTLLILVYKAQDLGSNIVPEILIVHLDCQQLCLFRLQLCRDLFIQGWNASLNMADQNLVKRG